MSVRLYIGNLPLVSKHNGQPLQDITIKVEKAMPRSKENEGSSSPSNGRKGGGKRSAGNSKPASYASSAPDKTNQRKR